MSAASTVRRATRDQGPKLSRPQTVDGKVSEKAATPRPARTTPPRFDVVVPASSTAIVLLLVALSSTLMHEPSSVAQLADSLRSELDRYSPDGKLPSNRALVERFRVSPVTVSRAIARLAA
ncbi:GntR family transcriptional regulator, partial [Streptomyces sp. NPDC057545]|uniref:GntR family transcriptional regulator n=1 Tax=Streptomyces sp. NPDC057545 TaxID=3346164 RepID=UPI00368A0641